MAKFTIGVGRKWDGLEATIEGDGDEPERLIEKLTDLKNPGLKEKEVVSRHRLAGTIVFALVLALVAAAVWGWQRDDFSGLQQIWAAGRVPLGWMAGYYFKIDGSGS